MAELPTPACPLGYPRWQLRAFLSPGALDDFDRWHVGQTGAICDGRFYDHAARAYRPSPCAAEPHGPVVYRDDLRAFLAGRPPLD